MRDLEEILKELNEAEKEYAKKCEEYGISEKAKRKKEEDKTDSNDEKKD